MKNVQGIKFGSLYAILLLIIYQISFFTIAINFIFGLEYPDSIFEGIKLFIGSGLFTIFYLALGIICFVASLILAINDRLIQFSVKNYLPIILAFIYILSPISLPGPIDDAIVLGVGGIVQSYFTVKVYNNTKDLPIELRREIAKNIFKIKTKYFPN